MKRILVRYLDSPWIPWLVHGVVLVAFIAAWGAPRAALPLATDVLLCAGALSFLGQIAATLWSLGKRRWARGLIAALLLLVNGAASTVVLLLTLGVMAFFHAVTSTDDGFADDLTIPEGIDIALPIEPEPYFQGEPMPGGSDPWQLAVRDALAVAGSDDTSFVPSMPSLRRASTEGADLLLAYLAASPDWHVFEERGHRFASRRWSYHGEPSDTLHGYISEFGGDGGFQTRCLLCLDREQWSGYAVQHAQEGTTPVEPEMSVGNHLHESRVMVECGGVWLEIFEQSSSLERRITKATVATIEQEFATLIADPEGTVSAARERSRALAAGMAIEDGHVIELVNGMQPGIYTVTYSLNPGEPGSVYLKAFEVTQGTPLSADRLAASSRTRTTWSDDPSERFGAKAGFTIYEGDWGKPYAARLEVWFEPDAGEGERKIGERVFRVEGWQR
jgi:hypothetical protein